MDKISEIDCSNLFKLQDDFFSILEQSDLSSEEKDNLIASLKRRSDVTKKLLNIKAIKSYEGEDFNCST